MRVLAGQRIAAGLVLLLAALVFANPPAGAADTGRFPQIGEFRLRGSNGYLIRGYLNGARTTVDAMSGQVGAEYTVRGRRRQGRLQARFGGLGRLALEFHPANRRESCRFIQRGTYRGTIEFTGEDGYTEVDAVAAKGVGFTFFPRECGASSSALEARPTVVTHLHAVAKRPRGATSVSVLQFTWGPRAYAVAARHEQRGAMAIVRYAYALVGGDMAFVASGPGKRPAFAYLEPPKPFAGSAVFEETGDFAAAWKGDLSVWLPGAGPTRLAGPSFASNLCRRRAEERGCALEPTVRRPLALQGSGSQSQLFGEARLSWSR
jgi:hypothetical protein